MIKELDVVALTCDVPEEGLRAGDIGTVVLEHGTAAYEVEFINFGGDTIAVITLEASQVRLVGPDEIRQIRPVERHP